MAPPPIERVLHLGFRFEPKPMDTITYYLPRLIAGVPMHAAVRSFVHATDIYACEPAVLAAHYRPTPKAGDRFFFTTFKRQPGKSIRGVRVAGPGYWHSQGHTKDVLEDEGVRLARPRSSGTTRAARSRTGSCRSSPPVRRTPSSATASTCSAGCTCRPRQLKTPRRAKNLLLSSPSPRHLHLRLRGSYSSPPPPLPAATRDRRRRSLSRRAPPRGSDLQPRSRPLRLWCRRRLHRPYKCRHLALWSPHAIRSARRRSPCCCSRRRLGLHLVHRLFRVR
jgi:hypothetical protein